MNSIPAPFSDSNLGIDFTYEEVIDAMASLNNWSERYKHLFMLANKLTPLDQQFKTDSNLIEGCESPVWLLHHYNVQSNNHYFLADSESKIIRGLLVIILSCCNAKSSQEIDKVQLEQMFKQLDLGRYLTPSRSNGLLAVLNKIKGCCQP